MATSATELCARLATDPVLGEDKETSLASLGAWHGPDGMQRPDGELKTVLGAIIKGVLEEACAQFGSTCARLGALDGADVEVTDLAVPQLETKAQPRVASVASRTGPNDSAGTPPYQLDFLGADGAWSTYLDNNGKACAQGPAPADGSRAPHYLITTPKGATFGVQIYASLTDLEGATINMLVCSHKKRPVAHATAPGAPVARLAGKMATYVGFGQPDDEYFEPDADLEFYMDIPAASASFKWDDFTDWQRVRDALAAVDNDDEPNEEDQPSDQFEFKVIGGETYIAEKRGKDTIVNVKCASFVIEEISQILAFNDRGRHPHYKVLCVIKLDPRAPIESATLHLGDDMATIPESRLQSLKVEVDVVFKLLTSQPATNAILQAAHPKLVWFKKDATAFVALIQALAKPPTTIAASTICRQVHDRSLFMFVNTAVRLDYSTPAFEYQTSEQTGMEFISTVFTKPDGNGVPLTPGLLPTLTIIPPAFDWLAYYIAFCLWNKVDCVVFGDNTRSFRFAWCQGTFVASQTTAFHAGRGKKSKGTALVMIHSEAPNTAKTAFIESPAAVFGLSEKAAGECSGPAMKRVVGLYCDMPVPFDDVVLGAEGSQSHARMVFLLSQFFRFCYDGTVRIVCGNSCQARSMPLLTSNVCAGGDDPALRSRAIMLEAGTAHSRSEILDLDYWRRMSSGFLPYVLMLCDEKGEPHKQAIVDVTRAFVAAIGRDMRQIETWAATSIYYANWHLLMQGSLQDVVDMMEWAVVELAHICHAEKTSTVFERFMLAFNQVHTSKGWDQVNPDIAVGIHNTVMECSPNPLAVGAAAKEWIGIRFTQMLKVLQRNGTTLDSNTLTRFIREVAKPAGHAILVARGHTTGNGQLQQFYDYALQSDGTQNPFPPHKLVAEDCRAEDVMIHGAGGRSIRVPLTLEEAIDQSLTVTETTLYIKRSYFFKFIADAMEGFSAAVTLRGVRIYSLMLGNGAGRTLPVHGPDDGKCDFIQDIVCSSSPLYAMAKRHPFAHYGGIFGTLELGDAMDPFDPPSVVDGVNEANQAFNGLHIAEQYSAGELSKIFTAVPLTEDDIAQLPPGIAVCPFDWTPAVEGNVPPRHFHGFTPGGDDDDDMGGGGGGHNPRRASPRDDSVEWSSGTHPQTTTSDDPGSTRGRGASGDRLSQFDLRVSIQTSTPELPWDENHPELIPYGTAPFWQTFAEFAADVDLADLADSFAGDDGRDPRIVRQRSEFDEPNSDEERMATEIMFGLDSPAPHRPLNAPPGLPPPSAPPSPPSPTTQTAWLDGYTTPPTTLPAIQPDENGTVRRTLFMGKENSPPHNGTESPHSDTSSIAGTDGDSEDEVEVSNRIWPFVSSFAPFEWPPSPPRTEEACLSDLADLATRPAYRAVYEREVSKAEAAADALERIDGLDCLATGCFSRIICKTAPPVPRHQFPRALPSDPGLDEYFRGLDLGGTASFLSERTPAPPFHRAPPQSFDATSLLHGDANNGCGPRTPFSQGQATTGLGSWDTLSGGFAGPVSADVPNEGQMGEMADALSATDLADCICSMCGGHPELCGGDNFCCYHQCTNTDTMGFQCERQKNSESQYCAECTLGQPAWFSEPIAPGVMWGFELSDEEDSPPPSELATAAKEKHKIINRSVHFAPPALSTTLSGFGSLGRSFTFSPAHEAVFVPTSEWVRPSSPLHHFPTAVAGCLWPHPPTQDMEQAGLRARRLAEEVKYEGTKLAKRSKPLPSLASPSPLNPNFPVPFPPYVAPQDRAPPQSFDATSLLHGDANNGCGPQTPFSQKCWVVLRQNEAAAVEGFFTNAFVISADPFRETRAFLRNLRGTTVADHDAVVYMNLTVQQMTNLYTTWDDLMQRGDDLMQLAPQLQSIVFIASPEIYEYIVTNKWAGHTPETIGGPPIACDSEWPRLFITEYAALLTLEVPDHAVYQNVIIAMPEGNEDYPGPNLPFHEAAAQLGAGIDNMDPGPPVVEAEALPDVILRSLHLERNQRISRLPIYATVSDTGITTYRAQDNDRLASHRNPYIHIYEFYDCCPSREELDLLDLEFQWDRQGLDFSAALLATLCEEHGPASSWWRDFPELDEGYLRTLSEVNVVEGRALNYMSPTFLADAKEFRNLPVAPTVTEVPTALIKIKDGPVDPLGFKLGVEHALRDSFVPTVDPIHPGNSDIQVAPEYHPPDDPPIPYAIHHLESKTLDNTTKEVMTIYDAFRRGTAEPEQVERMLGSAHALLTGPHRCTTWADEYFLARAQILNAQNHNKILVSMNTLLTEQNERLTKRVHDFEEEERARKSACYAENDGYVIDGLEDSDEDNLRRYPQYAARVDAMRSESSRAARAFHPAPLFPRTPSPTPQRAAAAAAGSSEGRRSFGDPPPLVRRVDLVRHLLHDQSWGTDTSFQSYH